MTTKTLNTLLAGALAVSTLGMATAANASAGASEKCYGVVKAGKNGCGSADKAHACAGQAEVDGSGVEWISLPAGTCEKLVGGSLEPIFEDAEADDEDAMSAE